MHLIVAFSTNLNWAWEREKKKSHRRTTADLIPSHLSKTCWNKEAATDKTSHKLWANTIQCKSLMQSIAFIIQQPLHASSSFWAIKMFPFCLEKPTDFGQLFCCATFASYHEKVFHTYRVVIRSGWWSLWFLKKLNFTSWLLAMYKCNIKKKLPEARMPFWC